MEAPRNDDAVSVPDDVLSERKISLLPFKMKILDVAGREIAWSVLGA